MNKQIVRRANMKLFYLIGRLLSSWCDSLKSAGNLMINWCYDMNGIKKVTFDVKIH